MLAARQLGTRSSRRVASSTRTTRSSEFSLPPSLTPNATSAPSSDGWYQSTAAAESATPAAGSARTIGAEPGAASERATSRACCAPYGRSSRIRRSPRTCTAWTTGWLINVTRRRCHSARLVVRSSAERVRSFWAATHSWTAGASASSSHRYGSSTRTPCRTSESVPRGVATPGIPPVIRTCYAEPPHGPS